MKYRGSKNRASAPHRGGRPTAQPRVISDPVSVFGPYPIPSPSPTATPNPTTDPRGFMGMKKGGKVKKDKRDGICQRGRTKGRIV